MSITAQSVAEVCAGARRASRSLARLDTTTKNAALLAMADDLERRAAEILEANARDMEAGRQAGLHSGLLDRLELKVNFTRPITTETGPVVCEGAVLHRGGRVATAEGRVTAERTGKLLAHGTTTCLIFSVNGHPA